MVFVNSQPFAFELSYLLHQPSYIKHQCYLAGAMSRRGAEHIGTRQARGKSIVEAGFDPYGFIGRLGTATRYSATVPERLFRKVKLYLYLYVYINIKFSFDFFLTCFLTVAL